MRPCQWWAPDGVDTPRERRRTARATDTIHATRMHDIAAMAMASGVANTCRRLLPDSRTTSPRPGTIARAAACRRGYGRPWKAAGWPALAPPALPRQLACNERRLPRNRPAPPAASVPPPAAAPALVAAPTGNHARLLQRRRNMVRLGPGSSRSEEGMAGHPAGPPPHFPIASECAARRSCISPPQKTFFEVGVASSLEV